MKKIIIKPGSKGAELLAQMRERKRELEENLKKSDPPPEVNKWIKDMVEETYKINKGNLDKQSYRLGLMAMWYHIYKHPELLTTKQIKHE